MRLRLFCLVLLITCLGVRSAQASFLWFFDEPLKYQSITLALLAEKDKIPVTEFVGRSISFQGIEDDVPSLSIVIKPEDIYHERQIRILIPKIAQSKFNINMTDMKKGESLSPKIARVSDKMFELIVLYKPAPKSEGEKKE